MSRRLFPEASVPPQAKAVCHEETTHAERLGRLIAEGISNDAPLEKLMDVADIVECTSSPEVVPPTMYPYPYPLSGIVCGYHPTPPKFGIAPITETVSSWWSKMFTPPEYGMMEKPSVEKASEGDPVETIVAAGFLYEPSEKLNPSISVEVPPPKKYPFEPDCPLAGFLRTTIETPATAVPETKSMFVVVPRFEPL